jgi:hypothetical protein
MLPGISGGVTHPWTAASRRTRLAEMQTEEKDTRLIGYVVLQHSLELHMNHQVNAVGWWPALVADVSEDYA